MDNSYDSAPDTRAHIETVGALMLGLIGKIWARIDDHDKSKLEEPEKSMYDKFTPMLRDLTYGSDEYKACLADMGVALQHHYENNSHHPEHYKMWQCPVCKGVFTDADAQRDARFVGDVRLCQSCCAHGTIMECTLEPASGVYGMNLIDLVEMLADWKAASLRHADGYIMTSLEINKARFGISDQLARILENTVRMMEQEQQ